MGRWGEALAARHLQSRGCQMISKGYHSRFGEIDIIAADDKYLIFTEVKLRKNDAFGPARAAVDARKQQKLRITAELYLAEHPTALQPRFDVIEIYAPQGTATRAPIINQIENAF